jgi:Bifunctional DNA primase/polymerase, N-terminal
MNLPAPWQERANPAAAALNEALRLASMGLIPCFPCRPNKSPACPHSFKDASTDAAQLEQLWRQYPGPLVGVPTGTASGIFVVDLDTAKHPEADEWLERHAAYIPETRRHRTRSGGLRLLFKHQAGLKNSTSKLAPGVDTRGEGGFIIWWPFHLGLGADHSFLPLAEVPDWLIAALNPPPPPPAKVISFPPIRPSPVLTEAKLTGIIRTVATANQGHRNSVTFWGACRIAEMVAEGLLGQAEGLAIIVEAASRTGLSRAEATRTALSAFRGNSNA